MRTFCNLVSVKVLTERQKAYRKYLLTDRWKALRERALERDGRECKYDLGNGLICEDTERLHVHHVVYRSKWEDTRLEDLQTICQTCHRIEHGLPIAWDIDWLHRKLKDGLLKDPAIYPSEIEKRQIVSEIIDDMDRIAVLGLFRQTASTKLYQGGKSVPVLMFHKVCEWSDRELKRLQKAVKKHPPERYIHVW